MKYSLIVPCLNEAKFITECLRSIRKSFGSDEIILVDGGSSDKTLELAYLFDVRIIKSTKGRGIQMNAGAEKASGDILIFVHADTFIPDNARQLIENEFANPIIKVATFRLGFDADHKILNFYSKFSNYDSMFTKFGDQCVIIRKSFYDVLGGFPKWSIFEDVQLWSKARKKTKIKILDAAVVTSARKFLLGGIARTQIQNALLFIKYFLGMDQTKIAQSYYSMNIKKKNAIIIFAKYPKHGNVKTRLAKTLGENVATKFYISCASHVFKESLKLKKTVVPFLFYPDREQSDELKNWAGRKFIYKIQNGTDLGQRMSNAFAEVFKNNFEKVLIIGTDIPDLSSGLINQALSELDKNDIVIGPSTDGGYYLLGMKKFHLDLFNNIQWSSEEVLNKTLNIINQQDLMFTLLPKLMDIDTEEDLKLWYLKTNTKNSHPVKEFIKLTLQQAN
ncbi:MAG: TIGR04283 family arsenosugar biosynthesis glycosyltransferase [Ignavibacteriales bacterium]|nr:TIGR04283 family arsenosugar biosynthesis glycosyltransferase [Ignavibacteriales bacterium]